MSSQPQKPEKCENKGDINQITSPAGGGVDAVTCGHGPQHDGMCMQMNSKKRKAAEANLTPAHLLPGTRSSKRRQSMGAEALVSHLKHERAQRHLEKAQYKLKQRRQRARKAHAIFRTDLLCNEKLS